MYCVHSLRTLFLFGIFWKVVQNVFLKSVPYEIDTSFNLSSRIRRDTGPGSLSRSCIIPPQVANGRWSFLSNSDAAVVLGQQVLPSTVIVVKCNKGYTLSSTDDYNNYNNIAFCVENGNWILDSNIRCEKVCPPIYNTSTTTVTCYRRGFVVPCDRATHRTTVRYSCNAYYENFGPTSDTCVHGTWSSPGVTCTAKCGEKRVKARPLIINGTAVQRGNYPWVVAIYSNFERTNFVNICGGSLLSLKLVLTAAHCVANLKNGAPYPTKYFRVAAGKYFNKYEDTRDQDTSQYSEINKIEVQPDFQGEVQNFRGDIAILRLATTLILSGVVQPVCYRDLPHFSINYNDLGVITGWGYTSAGGDNSDVLKELEIPYVRKSECRRQFGREWSRRYFTSDKICAGFSRRGKSVCNGDSGGGLVFKNPRNDRYYIHGIVSLSYFFQKNNQNLCDFQKSALFTRVLSYFDWLQEQVDALSVEGCSYPVIIENGRWIYSNTKTTVFIDESIPENSLLSAECFSEYKLVPDGYKIKCVEGQWNLTVTPVCERKYTSARIKAHILNHNTRNPNIGENPVRQNIPGTSKQDQKTSDSGGFTLKGIAKTARGWDCCKPSCSWRANVPSGGNPVVSCQANGHEIIEERVQSACDDGHAYVCSSFQPWIVNDSLAYGFVSTSFVGGTDNSKCCICLELAFNSTKLAGKRMIVQSINSGGDFSRDEISIQMPGGGVGYHSTTCSVQWKVPQSIWGQQYGGLNRKEECELLPAQLQAGCDFRFGWFKNAQNPLVNFKQITCPEEITRVSGCENNDV